MSVAAPTMTQTQTKKLYRGDKGGQHVKKNTNHTSGCQKMQETLPKNSLGLAPPLRLFSPDLNGFCVIRYKEGTANQEKQLWTGLKPLDSFKKQICICFSLTYYISLILFCCIVCILNSNWIVLLHRRLLIFSLFALFLIVVFVDFSSSDGHVIYWVCLSSY